MSKQVVAKTDWASLNRAVVKTKFNGLLSVKIEQVNGERVVVRHPPTGVNYKFRLDGNPTEHTSEGYSLHSPDSFTPDELAKFF